MRRDKGDTNPFFSTFFSLSTQVSPVSRTASTAILRFLALFRLPVCVLSSHLFWTSDLLDVPAGVTQEEGHRILCTNELVVLHYLLAIFMYLFFNSFMRKNPSFV